MEGTLLDSLHPDVFEALEQKTFEFWNSGLGRAKAVLRNFSVDEGQVDHI